MFTFRVTIKAHIAVGIVFNVVAFCAIKKQRYQITPQILHDGQEVNPRQARHNMTLANLGTLKGYFLAYCWCLTLVFAASFATCEFVIS